MGHLRQPSSRNFHMLGRRMFRFIESFFGRTSQWTVEEVNFADFVKSPFHLGELIGESLSRSIELADLLDQGFVIGSASLSKQMGELFDRRIVEASHLKHRRFPLRATNRGGQPGEALMVR